MPSSAPKLKEDTKLTNLLRGAITKTREADKWSKLSVIGVQIKKKASFDPGNYGYARLIGLFEAIDLFEINRKPEGIHVREKK